jgi:hypothetical protein
MGHERGGQGVQNPVIGGGPANAAGNPGGEQPKDETKPTPPAQEPENQFGNDDVAPKGTPQSGLQLRGLADALKDADTLKELEERTHLSKEQLEQFARQFEKPKVAPGREAQDVEVKVGEQQAVGPGANLPGAGVKRFSTDKIRQDRQITQDQAHGLNEGNRDQPPQELRDLYYGFKSKVGRATTKASPKGRP